MTLDTIALYEANIRWFNVANSLLENTFAICKEKGVLIVYRLIYSEDLVFSRF